MAYHLVRGAHKIHCGVPYGPVYGPHTNDTLWRTTWFGIRTTHKIHRGVPHGPLYGPHSKYIVAYHMDRTQMKHYGVLHGSEYGPHTDETLWRTTRSVYWTRRFARFYLFALFYRSTRMCKTQCIRHIFGSCEA